MKLQMRNCIMQPVFLYITHIHEMIHLNFEVYNIFYIQYVYGKLALLKKFLYLCSR